MSALRPVAVNLTAYVDQPVMDGPYAIDIDGHPYVPTGTGGIVLGVALGDHLRDRDGDHVAPGVTVSHPDPAAAHALASLSCLGNPVVVRTGPAAGATGWVVGKRGEHGQVLLHLDQDVLERLRPGDAVMVRARGQGAGLPPGAGGSVVAGNVDPDLLAALPVRITDNVSVGVRAQVESRVCGNGIGRPALAWDLDLALHGLPEVLAQLRYGDLVAVDDLDARTNFGYRRGWRTVGAVVHGPSPQPGHGPGLVSLLTGPATALGVTVDEDHAGVTLATLKALGGPPAGAGPGRS